MMTAPNDQNEGFGNRRRNHRIEVGQRLVLISVASRMDGELRDISETGALVSLCAVPPRRGRDVLLRWDNQEIFCQVVWSKENEVGVAFHEPLSPDELVATVGSDVAAMQPVGRRVL